MNAVVTAAVTAVITFFFTGLLGNYLVQRWQQRNWLNQHRLLGAEKRFEELQKLIDEITNLGDARTFRVRRIIRNRASDIARLQVLRDSCDKSVVKWNERFTAVSVKLTMYAGYSRFTEGLELDIQPAFVAISEQLDRAVRYLAAGQSIPRPLRIEMENMLNAISGKLFNFSRDLLGLLLTKQREAYEGEKVRFSEETLELFSRWYLFKALFKTNHPLESVSSTALDFHPPFFFRPERPRID